MRLPSTFVLTRSFLGGCAFLLLCAPAATAQDTDGAGWRNHFSLGGSLAYPGFAYRSGVPANLQLPALLEIGGNVAVTRQLTEHFALGVEQRSTGINYGVRYRSPGSSATGLTNGLFYQLGPNAQLLLPLGLRWELAALANASVALTSFGITDDALIWRTSTSSDGQSLRLHTSQLRQISLFTGAGLRLIYWLGGGPHGLQLSVDHQQGLLPLIRADSREFSYVDASGQRQQGAFGLRYKGSYSSVQLGYCYSWGPIPAAAKRRWSSPRYSQPAPPPDDDPETEAATDAE